MIIENKTLHNLFQLTKQADSLNKGLYLEGYTGGIVIYA
jgi:hypothetical protein